FAALQQLVYHIIFIQGLSSKTFKKFLLTFAVRCFLMKRLEYLTLQVNILSTSNLRNIFACFEN
ncbi:hypothetical protein, partial [Aerococcus viridans]|uniref:hypothetical protein n=1 Tax=Aerococcus viridans TaxID=1377 RepID=UPI001B7FE734